MLIGFRERGKVVLACSLFDGIMPLTPSDRACVENAVVWPINGTPHTVMGYAYPSREADAIHYEQEMFSGEISYERLLEEVVPAMEKFMKEKEYRLDDDKGYRNWVIAQGDKLFMVTWEHMIEEVDSFTAFSGRNARMAKSILRATVGMPVLDRIREVYEYVARSNQSDCYPIAVIDTESCKVRYLTAKSDCGSDGGMLE